MSASLLALYCSKLHGEPSSFSKEQWQIWWSLWLLPRSPVLQVVLVLAVLSLLMAMFISLCWSRARLEPCRLKALWMIPFFTKLFWGVKTSSFLSTSINPPDVTINHVYDGTWNHVPRKTATVMLSKPVAVLENSSSYLCNCFEEAVSDQERLKMLLVKMVSEIDRVYIRKGCLLQWACLCVQF